MTIRYRCGHLATNGLSTIIEHGGRCENCFREDIHKLAEQLDIRAGTIEECARVAEGASRPPGMHTNGPDELASLRLRIARDIRALQGPRREGETVG